MFIFLLAVVVWAEMSLLWTTLLCIPHWKCCCFLQKAEMQHWPLLEKKSVVVVLRPPSSPPACHFRQPLTGELSLRSALNSPLSLRKCWRKHSLPSRLFLDSQVSLHIHSPPPQLRVSSLKIEKKDTHALIIYSSIVKTLCNFRKYIKVFAH